jgi:hypothetical protein
MIVLMSMSSMWREYGSLKSVQVALRYYLVLVVAGSFFAVQGLAIAGTVLLVPIIAYCLARPNELSLPRPKHRVDAFATITLPWLLTTIAIALLGDWLALLAIVLGGFALRRLSWIDFEARLEDPDNPNLAHRAAIADFIRRSQSS